MRNRTVGFRNLVVFFLIIVSITFAPKNPTSITFAQESAKIDFVTLVTVPSDLHLPIQQAVEAGAVVLAIPDRLTVSALNYIEDWAYVMLVPTTVVESGWESELREQDIVEVLARRQVDTKWEAFVRGTSEFQQLLQETPSNWIDFSYLVGNKPLSPITPVSFRFPWTENQEWYKTQGWHDGNNIDFSPVNKSDPSVNMAVLADAEGVMTRVCGGRGTNDPYEVQIRISHPDGTSSYYLHLDATTLRYDLEGKYIVRGQYVGRLYNAYNYSTRCGRGTGPHIHYTPPSRDIWIDGFHINDVANSANNTKYVSSNPRIDDPYSPGTFTVDVHRSTGTSFSMARWATKQGGYWDTQKWFAGDFNGGGKTDFAKLWNDGGNMTADVHLSSGSSFSMQRWATKQGGYWDTQRWFGGDFNGDGKIDFAKLWNDSGSMTVDIHRSTGSSFSMERWATKQGGYWDSQKWFTGDFDGNGKTDIAKLWNDGGSMTVDVHLSTGSSFNMQRWATKQGGFWDSQKWFTGDFNGDRKTDLAKYWNDGGQMTIDVHLSTGSSFNISRWATKQGGYWDSQEWFSADLNGDQKTDIGKLWNDGGQMTADVHLSTGSSFNIQRWATKQGGFWAAQRWLIRDFNNDGKADLGKFWNDGGQMTVDIHVSDGTKFTMQRWATKQGGYWNAQKWYIGDFNGDGKTDLAKFWRDSATASMVVQSNNALLATSYMLAELPANSFSAAVTLTQVITFENPLPLLVGMQSVGFLYELNAIDVTSLVTMQPNQAYSITIQYDDLDAVNVAEESIALYRWTGTEWLKEPTSVVDIENDWISATPTTFGQWTIMGEAKSFMRVYLPLVTK